MNSKDNTLKREALQYHRDGKPGKIEVTPTKPYNTQHDLSLAYSPGVAFPCLEIGDDGAKAYDYTAKGNLVAVISNGTAVLGLGDIGPLAGKPVMEGKALLFKTFADIDVFDLELDAPDTETFIRTVKSLAPTFGGINLEDIKAPECFEIEMRLREELNIPVMHDDQHGTAIISAAALLNALEITGKRIDKAKVVVNGAGAAAISCARLYLSIGVDRQNLIMCDSKGVINSKRTDLSAQKKEFVTERDIDTLTQAVKGADVFLGLSVADILTQDMVRSMASDPIVFALANPDPEISYDKAMASREDIIFATGRSDHPNQVNNVLGFPFIFRGALDVRATKINEPMKRAAVYALAALAKEPVPETVSMAYGGQLFSFGREYLIPKPLDPRLLPLISSAVAKAAVDSGVATASIEDWNNYRTGLEERMGRDSRLMARLRGMASAGKSKRVIFSSGESPEVIKAAANLRASDILVPILLGDKKKITAVCASNNIDISLVEIIDPASEQEFGRRQKYSERLYERLNRRGVSRTEAQRCTASREWFAVTAVDAGDADCCIVGYDNRFADALQPVRMLSGSGGDTFAAMHIVTTRRGPMFFTDTAVNHDPDAEQLADIVRYADATVRRFGIEPVVAILSHSNFGEDSGHEASKVARAVRLLHEMDPGIHVEGEMKADMALQGTLRKEKYPFNRIGDREVNVFVFPNLSAANITYRLMEIMDGTDLTGPVLLGPVSNINLIRSTADYRAIRNLAVITAAMANGPKR